jgi:hypothetical protein
MLETLLRTPCVNTSAVQAAVPCRHSAWCMGWFACSSCACQHQGSHQGTYTSAAVDSYTAGCAPSPVRAPDSHWLGPAGCWRPAHGAAQTQTAHHGVPGSLAGCGVASRWAWGSCVRPCPRTGCCHCCWCLLPQCPGHCCCCEREGAYMTKGVQAGRDKARDHNQVRKLALSATIPKKAPTQLHSTACTRFGSQHCMTDSVGCKCKPF